MSRWKTAILCSFFAINLLIAVLLTIPLLSSSNSRRTLQVESNTRQDGEHTTEFHAISQSTLHSSVVKQSQSKRSDVGNEPVRDAARNGLVRDAARNGLVRDAARNKPYNISKIILNENRYNLNRQNNVYESNFNAPSTDFVRRTTANLPSYISSASKVTRPALKLFQSHGSTYLKEKTPERQIHEYVIRPRSDFCDESTAATLLIAVCSSVLHFELRQAIRSTWGREGVFDQVVPPVEEPLKGSMYPEKTRVLFVVALPDEQNTRLQSYVNSESSVYGDVLQLNFSDHYANLTLKTLGAMRWASEECKSASYFLKADDDVFINVPNVLHLIATSSELSTGSDVIVGHVMHDARPVRDRKSTYYTPYAVFRETTFPSYTSGSGYLLTAGGVEKLLAQSFKRSVIFWLEDIYFTGMLAKELGFTLVHDSRFNYNKKRQGRYRDACWYRDVVTEHGLTPEDLYQISIDAWWMKSKDGFSDRNLRSQNCSAADERQELLGRESNSRT